MSSTPTAGREPVLETVPAAVPVVEAGLTGLSMARPATDGSWLIDGDRSVAEGRETRPEGSASFPGAGTVRWHEEALGRAANLLLFPGLLRRDFAGREGAAIETIVCAPTLPLVVRQIEGRAEGAASTLRVEVVGDRPAATASIERTGSGVAVHGPHACIVVAMSPPADSIAVHVDDAAAPDRSSGPVEIASSVRIDITTSGPGSLIIAGGTAREVRTALRAAAHLKGHAVRATTGDDDRTSLQTGVAEIDEGWAWLVRRLSGHVRRGERHLLAARLAAQSAGDPGGAPVDGDGLLAARQARVFGDVAAAARIGAGWASGTSVPPVDDPLVSVAAEQLADALRYSATPDVIASLRAIGSEAARGRASGAPTSAPGRVRALPMVGRPEAAPSASHRSAAWASLLAGEPSLAPAAGNDASLDAVRLAADFRLRPNEAWNAWRTLLAQGLAGGPHGAATWDPDTLASLVLAIPHGLLGIEFDAPVGRLRIAPNMPEHLTRFTVRGIALGDAKIRFDFTREAGTLRYLITPEIANTPPLVVLEPRVPGTVRRVLVDGEVAELEVRPVDGHTIVPVQLPLDGPRLLEVEIS